jgi:hypothetical protein
LERRRGKEGYDKRATVDVLVCARVCKKKLRFNCPVSNTLTHTHTQITPDCDEENSEIYNTRKGSKI